MTDQTVAAGISYSYTVKAEDAAGNLSAASSAQTAPVPAKGLLQTVLDTIMGFFRNLFTSGAVQPDTTAPSAPATLTAAAVSDQAVSLSWPAATDDRALAGYRIFRNGSLHQEVTGKSVTATTDTAGLVAGAKPLYTISAVDFVGNESTLTSANAITLPSAPTPLPPINLKATLSGTNDIQLTWQGQASVDYTLADLKYAVYRGGTLLTTNLTATNYTDLSLTPATYSYTVRTLGRSGATSPDSVPTSLTIAASVLVPPTTPPGFAVKLSSTGSSVIYDPKTYQKIDNQHYTLDTPAVTAKINYLGDDHWRLEITRGKSALSKIYFPWFQDRQPLDADKSDDVYYYPYLLGATEKATNRDADWRWYGLSYPGETFAPFTILADNDRGKIVAATNWPPKRVVPQYAAERQVLVYDVDLQPGQTDNYEALIANVTSDPAQNIEPWQAAEKKYGDWLKTKMPPVTYPDWQWQGQGVLTLHLQNYPDPYFPKNAAKWDQLKSITPWVQFWGQMDNYLGGCCILNQTINTRFQPDFVNFVNTEIIFTFYVSCVSFCLC